jgi:hypothetical protein
VGVCHTVGVCYAEAAVLREDQTASDKFEQDQSIGKHNVHQDYHSSDHIKVLEESYFVCRMNGRPQILYIELCCVSAGMLAVSSPCTGIYRLDKLRILRRSEIPAAFGPKGADRLVCLVPNHPVPMFSPNKRKL